MYGFEKTAEEMKRHGMYLPGTKVNIHVPDAQRVLKDAFAYFLSAEKRKAVWLPEYDEVADWLTDNKGRGLFLYGDCGRGKSLLCRYILPAILLKYCQKVVSVFDIQEMNRNIDYVLSKHIVGLDDIGTEQQSIKYGERRTAFAEIMDMAEKRNNLVIVSSNLFASGIQSVYGDRVLDRIKSTTRRIFFEGESLRR